MTTRRSRPRPKLSKRATRLAQRRIEAEFTQREMSELTGLPLKTYRRLERGEFDNPPIRWITNCFWVLHSRLPKLLPNHLFEREWFDWQQLNNGPAQPPEKPRKKDVAPLFPD